MFKGFSTSNNFKTFPSLNFQVNNEAYGFSGCSFWLDAAYGTNTQTDLASISLWQSKIGSARFIQNTAGSQPQFILSDVNYNNLPSIKAVSGRFMDALNGLKCTNPFTAAIVSKVDTLSTNANILIGTSGNVGIFDGGLQSGYNGLGFANRGTVGVEMQGTSESINARIKIITPTIIMINGTSETISGSITSYRELLRIFQGAGDTPYQGTIAEIIGFSKALTIDECSALSTRLNAKYAIY